MARRRRGESTDSAADTSNEYETDTNPRPFAGLGGLYLSRSSRDAIDSLSPRENPWAMVAIIAQGMAALWRRPFRSTVVIVVFALVASFGVAFLRSTILVLAGRAKPVTADQVTDPTSATQVASWLGSQFGAPLAKTGTTALVRMSEDSLGGPQDAALVSEPNESPWVSRQGVEVSDRGDRVGTIQLIRPQTRRGR